MQLMGSEDTSSGQVGPQPARMPNDGWMLPRSISSALSPFVLCFVDAASGVALLHTSVSLSLSIGLFPTPSHSSVCCLSVCLSVCLPLSLYLSHSLYGCLFLSL